MISLGKKIKIIIDIYDLIIAFEDNSGSFDYYVDIMTGKVIILPNEFIDFEEPDKKRKKIENDLRIRYIDTPVIPSYEFYNDMKDFIETFVDQNLQKQFYVIIDGKGAFRRFKNLLLDYPTERQKWFEFKKKKTLKRIKEWLKQEGVVEISSKNTGNTS